MPIAEISRTTQPPTVPPAIAPLLGFDPDDFDMWGSEVVVVFVEFGSVEAGWRSQSRRFSCLMGGIEGHRPALVKCVTCRSAATSGTRLPK